MNLPFQIAKRLNVIVISELLGDIAGYYHKIKGQKIIHINESMSEWYKSLVVNHFLEHAENDSDEFHALMLNEVNNVEQARTPINTAF